MESVILQTFYIKLLNSYQSSRIQSIILNIHVQGSISMLFIFLLRLLRFCKSFVFLIEVLVARVAQRLERYNDLMIR
jgi:hypothetical protein